MGVILRRVALSLLVACGVPAGLFYVCYRVTDVWVAMLAALAWSYGAIVWRAATGRRTSGLLLLTAGVMTARTALAFAVDSSYLYFLQPIITDALIAGAFLISLATARPVVARLAGDFYPMDDEVSRRPRIQRLFWMLTLGWGTVGAVKAVTMLWLLRSQSLADFVLIKTISAPSLNALAVLTTIAAASLVARREGLLEPRPVIPRGTRATAGRATRPSR